MMEHAEAIATSHKKQMPALGKNSKSPSFRFIGIK